MYASYCSPQKMSCIIRLLDARKIELLDSLSGDYEDSFSLDSFKELCDAFATASNETDQKHFIIARVQTKDISNPDKVNLKLNLGIFFVLRCISAQQNLVSNTNNLQAKVHSQTPRTESVNQH